MAMKIITVLLMLHCVLLCSEGQQISLTAPVRVPSIVSSGECPSSEQLHAIHQNFTDQVLETAHIFSCGGTSGWRRVVYLDMTLSSQSCPAGLTMRTFSGQRVCGRPQDGSRGCWSTFFNNIGGSEYSRVCGRVRGYQFAATNAFFIGSNLDSNYVDGVSLTHGSPGNRTHIWTFASSLSELYTGRFQLVSFCRCVTPSARASPSFVGNNYFCESGVHVQWNEEFVFFPDPLWDGQNCISGCCEFNNPPYFTRTLPAPTTDDIELRICSKHHHVFGDSPIDQVELYVQ